MIKAAHTYHDDQCNYSKSIQPIFERLIQFLWDNSSNVWIYLVFAGGCEGGTVWMGVRTFGIVCATLCRLGEKPATRGRRRVEMSIFMVIMLY